MDKIGAKTHTHRVQMGCGTFYFRIAVDENENPIAVFLTIGKPGMCQAALTQGIARSITLGLEKGVTVEQWVKTFKGIHCFEAQAGEPQERKLSCLDALSSVLEKYQKGGKK